MTDQHPITPPPELMRHWSRPQGDTHPEALWFRIANEAAQWGYGQRGKVNEAELQEARDQELEACCKWLADETPANYIDALRAARRPKPPSLKQQALQALDEAIFMADDDPPEGICSDQADIIRRALEALPDD